MLETIAGVCRAVASDAKLLVLYYLVCHEELAGSELASRTRLTADGVSHHAQRLVGVGLVERRRSGARVFYRLAPCERPTFAARVVRLVRHACRDARWATARWDEEEIVHLQSMTVDQLGRAVATALDVVFDAATAFCSVRRLQLLRLLVAEGPCSEERISGALKMSLQACERHTDKLSRRGVISRQAPEGWVLSHTHRAPFHEALTSVVLEGLGCSSRS